MAYNIRFDVAVDKENDRVHCKDFFTIPIQFYEPVTELMDYFFISDSMGLSNPPDH